MSLPVLRCVARCSNSSPPACSPKKTLVWVFLMLLLLPEAPLGQGGTATLSGRVLDRTNGSPIGFASVIVEHAHSGEELTGVLTGEDGRFLVQGLAPAEYRIWTSFPGFHPVANDLVVGELNQSYDLGDIPLDRLEGFEEEITVTAEVPRAAVVDSRVFRLDDGPTQSTGSLLDAMKNLPGVTVDQDGRFRSAGVTVLPFSSMEGSRV